MFIAEQVESLAFVNIPYIYDDLCLIHPLKIGDLLALERKYDMFLKTLTIDKNFIMKIFSDKKIEINVDQCPTPLRYILESANIDDNFLLELQTAFSTFIREEVTILYNSQQIIIGDPKEKRILNESNFSDFQAILRLQNKIPAIEVIPEDESPRAKRFREKRELRDAIKNKQESKKAPNFSTLMSALCAYGIGITPFNIKDLSIYAFYSLLSINGSKERYNTEMNYIYAGADPKKLNPKHWIKNN